ncbi:MAG: hypothetical protein OSB09_11925 [Planctomycetota bacterium]|nr:hypothetical protein [Planctomycetota bacterium]
MTRIETLNSADPPPSRHDPVRWICAVLSLPLLGHGLLLLTQADPLEISQPDSPWPYLALGAMLAIRALVARPRQSS